MQMWQVIVSLVMPSFAVVYGIIIKVWPPKFRNVLYGFYSSSAAKKEETWYRAQIRYAEWNRVFGIISLVVVIGVLIILPLNQSSKIITNIVIGSASLICPYYITLIQMSKNTVE